MRVLSASMIAMMPFSSVQISRRAFLGRSSHGLGALALASLPYNLWLLAAALAGMTTGALTEIWLERRA